MNLRSTVNRRERRMYKEKERRPETEKQTDRQAHTERVFCWTEDAAESTFTGR